MGDSGKQSQEMEELGDGYYRIEINKDNLVAAYESTHSAESGASE